VVPVQVAAPQMVPDAYIRHFPAPSQAPSRPQLVAPESAHWPSGSAPAATVVHVPAVPGSAQDWQIPLQAAAQQTPCSQKAELHSPATLHETPSGFLPQLPFTQVLGAEHSAFVVQVVRQPAVPSQVKGAQVCVAAGVQVPFPSQRATSVIVEPLHAAALQTAPLGYLRQAPAPSQTPSRPHDANPSSAH
jgi:hypothetical protein